MSIKPMNIRVKFQKVLKTERKKKCMRQKDWLGKKRDNNCRDIASTENFIRFNVLFIFSTLKRK